MPRDYSGYTIAELREALRAVDGYKYPENKAAIEAELQARVDSGELAREQAEARRAAREKATRKLLFAKRARVYIAWYLLLSPALVIFGYSIDSAGLIQRGLSVLLGLVFMAASIAAGIGLLKREAWGHWIAVVVLGSQALRIQSEVFTFNFLSSIAVYAGYQQGGTIFLDARFEPGFVISTGGRAPFWIEVNLLVIALLHLLFKAREEAVVQ